jgi:hypothetical protein
MKNRASHFSAGVAFFAICALSSLASPAAAQTQGIYSGAHGAVARAAASARAVANSTRITPRTGPNASTRAVGGVSSGTPPDDPGIDDELVDLREDYLATLRGLEDGVPFDYGARARAIEFVDQMSGSRPREPLAAEAIAAAAPPPSWVELGPSPIPNGQTSPVVPVSGRVTAIEVDPADPNKVYVGTAQGGVYRTLDGGTTWTPLMDSAQSLAVGSLALDAPNNRLFVGTGEANGSADSFGGVGIYRIDAVNTAPALVGPINPVRNYNDASNNPQSAAVFTGRSIAKILIVPNDPTTLFVGTAGGVVGIGGDSPLGGAIPPLGLRGLYKITGATGAPASAAVARISVVGNANQTCFDTPCTGNRNVNDMVFEPTDGTGNTLIVWLQGTTAANDGGAYRSTNALAASPVFTQSLATTLSSARAALASFAAIPPVVYAATGENNGALRLSTNGGASFGAALAGGGGFCGGQCFYDIALAVLPGATRGADKILLGGSTGTLQQATSLDGGATFTSHAAGTHADSHALKFAPSNASIVYRGDDGGVFKSTDGGNTWTSLNNSTFRATQFSGLSVHPTDPNFTIGGTQDNGTNMLLPGGASWNRIDFGDGGFALIDQNATDTTNVTMYHTYFNQTNNLIGFGRVATTACGSDGQWSFHGIYGGAVDSTTVYCDGSKDTFNGIAISDSVNFYAPMALGPGNPNSLYFGTNKIYRSADKGETMPAVSQTFGSNVSSIAVSPQDDNFRLVGLNNGGLFFTTAGSTTLTSLDPVGAGTVIPDKYVGRVLFDPTNKNTAYIGLGGYMAGVTTALSHVWKVTNLNTTPTLAAINGAGATGLPDVPVNGLAVDPAQPQHLYVGTDIGVFVSLDGGATWNSLGAGLPRVAVFGMEVQKVKRVLRIATHGRGLWEFALPPVVTLNTASIAANAPTLVISGVGFDAGTPANNTVTFNSGAGTVTAATATQLTVTFTSPPSVGTLTAVVATGAGSSGAPVQVATVTSVPSQTLTVSNAGTGGGTVTSSPAGINCGTTCNASFATGTVVTLTATPSVGSIFTGWSGGGCSGTGTCVVTMNAAQSVTATFTLQSFALTVAKSGAGGGTVTSSPAGINCGGTCSASFASGTSVTLTAAPAVDSTFAGWSGGGCSGTGSCTVSVTSAIAVTATFTLQPQTLSVALAGTGSGTVTSSPAGINCPGSCSASFAGGTVVTLSPTAAAGSFFSGWSGACSGNGSCAVTMNAAQSVTATFTPGSNRTWVSRFGADTGVCPRSAPCLTFQFAHDHTIPSGALDCVDSGDFGPLTITRSITIKCTSVMASIAAASGAGITIAAGAADKIVIDGLDIEGLSTGSVGISVGASSKVHVLNTTVRNFASQGIALNASNTHVFIDNSFVIGNPTGVIVSGTNNIASLTGSSVRASPTASLNAATASAIIGVETSVINDSPVGIARVAGAQVISVGPSNLVTGAGTFTLTLPFE